MRLAHRSSLIAFGVATCTCQSQGTEDRVHFLPRTLPTGTLFFAMQPPPSSWGTWLERRRARQVLAPPATTHLSLNRTYPTILYRNPGYGTGWGRGGCETSVDAGSIGSVIVHRQGWARTNREWMKGRETMRCGQDETNKGDRGQSKLTCHRWILPT